MVFESFRLDDRNALVTGSSRGLGTASAVALAQGGRMSDAMVAAQKGKPRQVGGGSRGRP
jgi:NAD(P)-dependent dehydrogenase (short-subunit alcohol dehydrogenase family)